MAGPVETPHLPGNRALRRIQLKAEETERASGHWSPWMIADLPNGPPGASGWLRNVRKIIKNPWCALLVRPVPTPWGVVHHVAIKFASEGEPKWKEKQRIKDELFGKDLVAVEVMPQQSEITDGANMFHIFVLPAGVGLPFGI